MKNIYSFIIAICITSTLFSQVQMRVNVITLLENKPLKGIPVIIENKAIGFADSAMSNDKGQVVFNGLSLNGSYVVKTPGNAEFAGTESNEVELRSDFTRTVSLSLATTRTKLLDEVTVRSKSIAKINTVNAEVSSELTAKELRVLPVEGRDISRALYRLPNVAQATATFTEGNNITINGFGTQSSIYMIDGLENVEAVLNQPKFPMTVGFTKNINVLTNNYSVEYGGTYNGIINVTTKSGSNKVTGEAFYLVRPGRLTDGVAKYSTRDLTGNPVKDGFQRHQVGFGVGGPIVKNRTFYYLNAEQTFDKKDYALISNDLGVASSVGGKNNFTLVSGKVDQFWTSRFKSTLRVNTGKVMIQKQGGGVDGDLIFPEQGLIQDRNGTLVALQNSYSGSNFTSQTDIQYSTYLWNYYRPMNAGLPTVIVLAPNDRTLARLGSPGTQYISNENTWQVAQKFGFTRNNHNFKVGIGIISSRQSLIGGGNPLGEYTVKLSQAQLDAIKGKSANDKLSYKDIPADAVVRNLDVELSPGKFGTTQNRPYAYIEDLWSVNSKLNVTLGLRWDYDNLSKSGDARGDYNNVGPRVNFNYKLNDRSVIRGGYGIHYDKILYTIYGDALQFTSNSDDYKRQIAALQSKGMIPASANINALVRDGNLKANVTGATYLNGPVSSQLQSGRSKQFSNELRIMNPDGWQNPYSHQASIGYQVQIGEDKLFYTDLMLVDVHNLFRLRDLNPPAPYSYSINPKNIIARSVASADSTRTTPIYRDGRGNYTLINGDTLRGVARTVSMSESKGRARYVALSLNYQKDQGKDKYAYRLTYTMGAARANTEGINFKAQDSNNWDNEWGPTNNDRTNIFNGLFFWYPLHGLSVNVSALIQSGMPINRVPDGTALSTYNNGTSITSNGIPLRTADLNGDGRAYSANYSGNNDRQPGEGRNSDRLPWSNNFDAAVQYNFTLRNDTKFQVRVDCFNMFNTPNLSGYSNNALNSNQIQNGPASSGLLVRRSYGPPRQFQMGVNYYF